MGSIISLFSSQRGIPLSTAQFLTHPTPSTGDKLATALQPPFNGRRCPDNVALSRAGSGLRCCICVFTVIGRKVGGGSGGGGMVGIVVH